jgi:hypothetical protein
MYTSRFHACSGASMLSTRCALCISTLRALCKCCDSAYNKERHTLEG